MYKSVYKVGRLTFEAEVNGSDISLMRLPVLPSIMFTHYGDQSYHVDQMCIVHFKQGVAELAAKQGVSSEEFIGMCNDNAGFDSDHFVVAEYTGRDGSSENLTPDTALDGFMEWEIEQALTALEQDSKLIDYLLNAVANQLLIG